MRSVLPALALPLLIGPLTSCSIVGAAEGLGSSSLPGTYTGVLQESGASAKYYVSLDQTVTVAQANPAELSFSSSAFPSFNAVVVSTGDSAVASPVGFSSTTGVELQEVAFTKNMNGTWILVIQTASGLDGGANGQLVQFASYDPMSAPPASADLAVKYLDQMFALATGNGDP